ncbi:PucR family transcriptional regulator [Paenibacillus sp. GSMTC-2017]|uniref:PucR family transcriptional regulator n=1 Tax=Paenibacillus sp. GSMTC-2017 TaxID=2794350 RepID=UPI0018D74E86|nr:PucR family transcriptional regulator [Paenibacillus sp. GSMTC-2017]MBH5319626.1 PucR family transcriptional regulator [Paenibacillus sp. GSMTC-2017]
MITTKDPFDRSFESLEALADMISDVLHNPVTIEDDNHRLIAYSSHDSQTDAARVATIIGRRVPEKVISTLWRDGIMQRIHESEEPISIAAVQSIGLGNRLAIAIRKQHTILGYIWVLEADKPFDEDSSDNLKKAAHAATTKLLQLQVKKRKEEKGHEDFFWQLLTGHLSTRAGIMEKAALLGIDLPQRYQIIVLEFDIDINEKGQQIEYMLTTTQRIRVLFHTIHHNQLILLYGLGRKHGQVDEHAIFFEYVFEQMQLRFGFSPVDGGSGSFYDDYVMVERSYREALMAIHIRQRFSTEVGNIYHYPDLGYYRLLPAMLAESSAHHVENQCLTRLKQYDEEHNSDLLHTLEVFLSFDSNVKEAAKELHVHFNTLSYRLKRISEIGGIDLGSMDQKVTTYLDLKLSKLTGTSTAFVDPHNQSR